VLAPDVLLNQPTVDSTDDDVHDVNINVNVNIVTPTKKATRKMPTKATTALNAPTTKEKTLVDFGGPTMNQPTVNSTNGDIDIDVIETSQDVEVNVNIVTPTKKVKKST
jgi:hypothetical protein